MWPLSTHRGEFHVYRGSDAPSAGRLTGGDAATRVRAWLEIDRFAMIDAHDAVSVAAARLHHDSRSERDARLARALEEAFRRGELVAVAVAFKVFKATGLAIEKIDLPALGPQEIVEEVPEDTTWVGIELVDDSDPPAPVPFEAYELELADGSVLTGSLDADGRAKVDRVVRGPTKVRFPALDGSAWKLA